jgi:hypothetical protein
MEIDMESDRHSSVRAALRSLPARVPPQQLRDSVRLMASRERVRNASRRHWSDSIRLWVEHVQFSFENLMRPLALPTAGGLFSAIILFSMLMPGISAVRANFDNDVPISLTTGATVRGVGPLNIGAADIVVELIVDEQGRMLDYQIIEGQQYLSNAVVRRNLESNLLLTEFRPATAFGQKTVSRVRVSLSSSRIDVKG